VAELLYNYPGIGVGMRGEGCKTTVEKMREKNDKK
jgi:hypothetical protein